MNTPPLLVELFTEELPPKSLRALADDFGKTLAKQLRQDGFLSANSTHEVFATPRRLAVRINDVHAQALSREVLTKGPSVSVGLGQDGKPTPALLGFAKKAGISVEQLERQHDGKQEVFVARTTVKGETLASHLELKLQIALDALPIAKRMQYQLADGVTNVEFARPAHRLVVLHGNTVIPVSVLGLQADRVTQGHRFQAQQAEIALAHAGEYESKLESLGAVIAGFDQRRNVIERALRAEAQKLHAQLGNAEDVAALLEEVTALVEWPAVYVGAFEPAFLQVPQECLALTMRANQKYFPLFDAAGKLTHRFLIVSNMRLDDASNIITGNQRVIRPRLADAQFFFETDKKTTLAERVPQLGNIVYHNKLGTQLARVQRVQKLAGAIAGQLRADAAQAARAAELCKADLLTLMVGEFPELQGVMGAYYAQHDGEPAWVAQAIREHYYPRFANDALPGNAVSISVALADKLDTLAGIFGIGMLPSGDKDPFALRRHALGVMRILVEKALPLDLNALLHAANAGFAAQTVTLADHGAALHDFMLERLRGYLREQQFETNEIEAVLGQKPARIDQVVPRLRAVQAFKKMPEAASLAAANKRIQNILKKTAAPTTAINPALLVEPAEKALYTITVELRSQVDVLLAQENYTAALSALVHARAAVDAFFEAVMVMSDDAAIRDNRLALLRDLGELMNKVADISKLAA